MFSSPVGAEQLAERLAREIGLFERKVEALEERCRQIRLCAARLASELSAASSSFSASTPAGDGLGACREDLETPVLRLVELCGIKDHVENAHSKDAFGGRVGLIIHEPGGGILTIEGPLPSGELDNNEICEALRRRIAELGERPAGRNAASCAVTVLYVPRELGVPASLVEEEERVSEALGHRVVVAPPSILFAILKGVAIRWLSFSCARNARALVDNGQDLVDDLSGFISDFTESEKNLCAFVDRCVEASRSLDLPARHLG